MIAYKIICILATLYTLFSGLSALFGWAHRYGWKFLITKTESMLSGKPLSQYRVWKAFLDFAFAGFFMLSFFDHFSTARMLVLLLISVVSFCMDKYFRQFTVAS